ncbi:hypothetical protein KI427_16815 [Rhodococcus ruber]|uniref:hypothetical protein n=1 Tax=Rhodococcus ruber TaxID=1830 RepID=UPI0007438CA1|nr:hypothetical protein [Rhodococcus ruber]AUM17401.1 hypothetical protein CSW53_13265 [Rhodococcus ruber]QRE81872.1 hypothetical protein F1734_17555 [Rhodococcus ruber]UQB71279.1 hypothetical protein KI427_16815 [Rhodococcus ruber]
MVKSSKWHPWRYIRDHHPHLRVHFVDPAEGSAGHVTRRGIEIDKTCNQAERRSTLTHELTHYERGPVPDHPYFGPREERVVERLTARQLIELDHLVDALLWTRGRVNDDTAEELWVDLEVLETRIQHLTPRERDYVEREITRRQP